MSLLLDFTDTPEIHDLYHQYNGTLAFDIGANGGQTANIFAEHFATVVACEPASEPWEYLISHVAENVLPLNVAISDHNGEVLLQEREMSKKTGYLFTGNTLPEWGDVLSHQVVECMTLDILSNIYGTPDFVKIDTEGHEVQVVRGGIRVFFNRPEYLIEIHSEENGEKVSAMLQIAKCPARIVRHEAHHENSHNWRNHYWLVNA